MMIPAHVLAGVACIHLGRLVAREKPIWIWLGIFFAFLSHAILDALAIFTYHDGSPSGSLYSQFVFWFWLVVGISTIYWALRKDRRYGFGILAALSYDLWDHWFLRIIACAPDGFPNGCMNNYAYEHLHLHHLEWLILDTVFTGVQRHYGDEAYFIVELLFVGLLCLLIWKLQKHVPLPNTQISS